MELDKQGGYNPGYGLNVTASQPWAPADSPVKQGGIEHLADAISRMIGSITVVEDRLVTVVRPAGPQQSGQDVPHGFTPFEAAVATIEDQISRLRDLADRIVL
jgi:hypothetical protein